MKKDNKSSKLLLTIKCICLILIVLLNSPLISAQTPYGGIPWVLPGTIQNEDFDLGGQNVGYYDQSSANDGGYYRTSEGVDIFFTDGQDYWVGKPRNGEWQRYTVEMEEGVYHVVLRYASSLGTGKLKVYIDNNLLITHNFASTGSNWQVKSLGQVAVTGGLIIKALKLEVSGSYLTNQPKLDWIQFEKISPPGTPSDLTASLGNDNAINLSWTDNATSETTFRIERRTSSGTFEQIATVLANVTSYTDTAGLTCGTTYYYRVASNSSNGSSAYSNECFVVSVACPGAPANLITNANSNTQIGLNWTDNSDNETGFMIERRPAGSAAFELIATVGANVTSYINDGLPCGTSYYYRIMAYNDDGNSGYSNESSGSTRPCIQTPTNLTATLNNITHINLSWTDNATNEIGYRIERKKGNGIFSEIASVEENSNAYIDDDLVPNTVYTYRVYAYNDFGTSVYSNEIMEGTDTFQIISINTLALDNNYSYTINGLGTDSTQIYETGDTASIGITPDTVAIELSELLLRFTSKDNTGNFQVKLQLTDLPEIRNVLFKQENDFVPMNQHFYSTDTSVVSFYSGNSVFNSYVRIQGIDGITKIPGEPVTVLDLNEYTNATMSIYRDVDLAVPVRTVSGTLVWDGKDMNGTDAMPGIYVMVINLNDGSGKSLQSHFIIK